MHKRTKYIPLILFNLILTAPLFAETIDYVGYKELYDNQLHYNDKIIDTIITIFAIACGLVLANQVVSWFTDQRKYNNFVGELKKQQNFINEDFKLKLENYESKINEANSKVQKIIKVQLNTIKEVTKTQAGLFMLTGQTFELSKDYELALLYYCLSAKVQIRSEDKCELNLHNINAILFNVEELESSIVKEIEEVLTLCEDKVESIKVRNSILDRIQKFKLLNSNSI